jgi:cytochrome c oxidase cbb3-type subunit 2
MRVLKIVGVPYTEDDLEKFAQDIQVQLGFDVDQNHITDFEKRYSGAAIRKFNKKSDSVTEMDALVSYLQGLGNKIDLNTNRGRDW